jgi:tetratricopeptide (TPR) repeat protein
VPPVRKSTAMSLFRLWFGISATAVCLTAYADDLAISLRTADKLWEAGNKAAAEKLLLNALRATQGVERDGTRRASVLSKLGSAYLSEGRYTAAESCYRRAIDIWKQRAETHEELVRAVGNLAVLYLETGQYAKADRLQLRSIVAQFSGSNRESADVSWLLATQGVLDYRCGRYAEAETNQNDALAIAEKLAPLGPEITQILNNLGVVQLRTRRYGAALSSYRRALAIADAAGTVADSTKALLLANLGTAHLMTSGPSYAEPFYVDALASARDSPGSTDLLLGRILWCYAVVLRQTNRNEEAERMERRSTHILQKRSRHESSHMLVDSRELLRRPAPLPQGAAR